MATVIGATMLTGCASIFEGETQTVTIGSEPAGATVSVTNREGEKVHTGTTPVTLTLKRGAGYFKSEQYTVAFSKEGYADKQITLTSTVNGWYIGNILFGGVIGMLAVDPATGAMYSFPEKVNATLDAPAATKTSQAAQTLTIVSTESLSPEQMKNARLLAAAQ
jgi:hypothetical protein